MDVIFHLILTTAYEAVLLLSSFYRWDDWGLISGRAGTESKSGYFQSSAFNHNAYSFLTLIKVRLKSFRKLIQWYCTGKKTEKEWLGSGCSQILEDTVMRTCPEMVVSGEMVMILRGEERLGTSSGESPGLQPSSLSLIWIVDVLSGLTCGLHLLNLRWSSTSDLRKTEFFKDQIFLGRNWEPYGISFFPSRPLKEASVMWEIFSSGNETVSSTLNKHLWTVSWEHVLQYGQWGNERYLKTERWAKE